MSEERFESWCVLELMGHVRMAGRVSEENRFGTVVGRIDVPKDGGFTTVYFSGQSIYRMTPCTEEVARAVANGSQPEPVHAWEMQRLPSQANMPHPGYGEYHDNDDPEIDDDSDDKDDPGD